MERNKRDLGYYGERLSKIGEYNVEEINNPSTKDDKKNKHIVSDIQALLLNIYSKNDVHRQELIRGKFSKSQVYHSSINSEHLWLVFKNNILCAYASGTYIYTSHGEQVYVFKACMISPTVENKADLYARLCAKQIIRGVLSYWNNSEHLGKPLPFITRTLNPVVAQSLYKIGSNMYPGLDGLPITESVRSRYSAFEQLINEPIREDGILVNSFMKHNNYALKPTKGKSLRAKIHNFCRNLGDSNGAAITGELKFEAWFMRHLYEKSNHDPRGMHDVGLIKLLQNLVPSQISSTVELMSLEGE